MRTNDQTKTSVKFMGTMAMDPPKYPDSLIQEITENFKNLNIPLKYETKRRFPRIAKS